MGISTLNVDMDTSEFPEPNINYSASNQIPLIYPIIYLPCYHRTDAAVFSQNQSTIAINSSKISPSISNHRQPPIPLIFRTNRPESSPNQSDLSGQSFSSEQCVSGISEDDLERTTLQKPSIDRLFLTQDHATITEMYQSLDETVTREIEPSFDLLNSYRRDPYYENHNQPSSPLQLQQNELNGLFSILQASSTPLQMDGLNENQNERPMHKSKRSTSLYELFFKADALFSLKSDSPSHSGNQSSSSEVPSPGASVRRPRSLPRYRSRRKTNEDEELKCPTCKNQFGMYIYQCRNGHSSCKECRNKGEFCGLCDYPITGMRSLTLESYVSERTVRCWNGSEGCRLFCKIYQMEAHLKECPFKEIDCPIASCNWHGKFSKIGSHFDAVHREHRHGVLEKEMFVPNITISSTTLHFIKKGPYNFLIHVKVDDAAVYMTSQLIGTCDAASRWTYDIHVYISSQPRRKHRYIGICHSNSILLEDIFEESKCMKIPMSYAMTFADEGRLTFKFFLEKDYEYIIEPEPGSEEDENSYEPIIMNHNALI